MLLDHIAIIVSSMSGIEFYRSLGFEIRSREDRGYDQLFYLSDGSTTLEIYVDRNHPARLTKPEALGLRHLGLRVEDVGAFLESIHAEAEIKRDAKGRFAFLYDPDGLPIEIREADFLGSGEH